MKLSKATQAFIADQIAEGRFSNEAEVIEEAVQQMQEDLEAKQLRNSLIDECAALFDRKRREALGMLDATLHLQDEETGK